MSMRQGTVLRSHGPGQELAPESMELLCEPGETVVEMHVASVTQLDRAVLAGKLAQQLRPPFVPGSEGAGVVVESRRYEPGTPVVVRGGGVGVARPGTWASLAVVPDDSVHPVPAGLDARDALALLTPALTAHTAVRRVAEVVAGETVVVTGATGLVGRLCAVVARAAGAARVVGMIGVDRPADSLTGLVDQIVRVDDLGQVGRDLPWSDAVIDTVGGPVTGAALDRITPGGRIAVLGYSAGEFATLDLRQLVGRDLRVLPVNMQRTTIEPGTVTQILADLATAPITPDIYLMPAGRTGEALDLLTGGRTERRVLLDLTGLR